MTKSKWQKYLNLQCIDTDDPFVFLSYHAILREYFFAMIVWLLWSINWLNIDCLLNDLIDDSIIN